MKKFVQQAQRFIEFTIYSTLHLEQWFFWVAFPADKFSALCATIDANQHLFVPQSSFGFNNLLTLAWHVYISYACAFIKRLQCESLNFEQRFANDNLMPHQENKICQFYFIFFFFQIIFHFKRFVNQNFCPPHHWGGMN